MDEKAWKKFDNVYYNCAQSLKHTAAYPTSSDYYRACCALIKFGS